MTIEDLRRKKQLIDAFFPEKKVEAQMPVGWNVPRGGKYAALNNIDKRLESLRDEKNVIVTRAGENALAGNTTRVTALKAQYELLGEKIKLLTDVRRDVEQTGDLEW